MIKSKYFIALLPTTQQQAQITELKEYMSSTYNSSAALKSPPHITLHPPFHYVEAEESYMFEQLAGFSAKQQSFNVQVNGFNAFTPRVIYVDVVKNTSLQQLYDELEKILAFRMGINNQLRKGRQFHPHITIAFSDLKPGAFRAAWKEFRTRDIEFNFEARQITLLKHNGKTWEILHSFPFEPIYQSK